MFDCNKKTKIERYCAERRIGERASPFERILRIIPLNFKKTNIYYIYLYLTKTLSAPITGYHQMIRYATIYLYDFDPKKTNI